MFSKNHVPEKQKTKKPLHNKLVLLSSSSGVLQMDTFSLLVSWKTSCHLLKTPVDFDCMWIGVLHCTCRKICPIRDLNQSDVKLRPITPRSRAFFSHIKPVELGFQIQMRAGGVLL